MAKQAFVRNKTHINIGTMGHPHQRMKVAF